jgi:RND family efflux transporter MFP subunit
MNRLIRFTLPWLILVIGASIAYAITTNGPTITRQAPPLKLPRVEVIKVSLTSIQIDIESRGVVKPRIEMKLVSEVSGRIIKVAPRLRTGSFFSKGDILVSIDPRDQNHAILAAKAKVASAKKALLLEQTEATLARKNWKKKGRVKATPIVLREPHIAEAIANLSASQGELTKAKLAEEQTRLRAYFDGLVREKFVAVGQFVSSGETLATLLSTDIAEIRLPLSEDQLAYLDLPLLFGNEKKIQQRPSVTLQAKFAGKTFKWQGNIVASEGVIDEETRQLYVIAQVQDPYNRKDKPGKAPLSTGLFVQATIQGKILENVFALPRSALYGKHQLLIVKNARIYLQKVDVLRLESNRIIVRGLLPGQQVVTHRMKNVIDGMRVQITEAHH